MAKKTKKSKIENKTAKKAEKKAAKKMHKESDAKVERSDIPLKSPFSS